MFLSSSAMVTNTVITIHNAKGLPGPNPWPRTFMGIMWSTTTLMAVVCVLMWVQWLIASKHCCKEAERSVQGDARPVEEWKSEATFVNS
jgi:hypothetical protein